MNQETEIYVSEIRSGTRDSREYTAEVYGIVFPGADLRMSSGEKTVISSFRPGGKVYREFILNGLLRVRIRETDRGWSVSFFDFIRKNDAREYQFLRTYEVLTFKIKGVGVGVLPTSSWRLETESLDHGFLIFDISDQNVFHQKETV